MAKLDRKKERALGRLGGRKASRPGEIEKRSPRAKRCMTNDFTIDMYHEELIVDMEYGVLPCCIWPGLVCSLSAAPHRTLTPDRPIWVQRDRIADLAWMH